MPTLLQCTHYLLLALLLTACGRPPLNTPEALVLADVESSSLFEGVTIARSERWERGVIVLIQGVFREPGSDVSVPMIGQVIMEQESDGGWVETTRNIWAETHKPNDPLIVSVASPTTIPPSPVIGIWGKVFDDRVTVIRATFDNGEILTDSPQQGLFTIVVDQLAQPCEVHGFDASGQVIYHRYLINDRTDQATCP